MAIILPAPLAALGGHKLFQATLMCNNPLQFLHLSVVLGKVLHCLLPHHGHLGLSLHPEVEGFIHKMFNNQDREVQHADFYHITQLPRIRPGIISSSRQVDNFPDLLADIQQFLRHTRISAEMFIFLSN